MTIDASKQSGLAEPHGSAKSPGTSAEDVANINEKIAALDNLGLHSLRLQWRKFHGSNAPARLGAEFLKRAITFRLQEEVLGGLSRQARLRLKALDRRSPGDVSAKNTMSALASVKAGTRFLREWQGETHEVQALKEDQFVYRGEVFRSLSQIASAITGTHQSGPRFFGLKDAGRKTKVPRGIDG